MPELTFAPPFSAVEPVTEILHGVPITDPYRWLEDQDSPRTRKWIEEQRQFARACLDRLPGRDRIRQRIREFLAVETYDSLQKAGSRYFFRKRLADQEQPCIYMREEADGEDQLLVDPAEHGTGKYTAVKPMRVSPDGRLLLFEVKEGGERTGTFKLLEIESKKNAAGCSSARLLARLRVRTGRKEFLLRPRTGKREEANSPRRLPPCSRHGVQRRPGDLLRGRGRKAEALPHFRPEQDRVPRLPLRRENAHGFLPATVGKRNRSGTHPQRRGLQFRPDVLSRQNSCHHQPQRTEFAHRRIAPPARRRARMDRSHSRERQPHPAVGRGRRPHRGSLRQSHGPANPRF